MIQEPVRWRAATTEGALRLGQPAKTTTNLKLASPMRTPFLMGSGVILSAWLAHAAMAQELKTPATRPAPTGGDAGSAWNELLRNSQPPSLPESWQTTTPSQEEFDKFRLNESKRLTKAAEQAKDFQAQYPNHPKAAEARTKEYQLLEQASKLGDTNVLDRLDALDAARLRDPKLSDGERFQIRIASVNRYAMSKLPDNMTAALAVLDKGAHGLIDDFPKRQEPYELLLFVASKSEPPRARELAKEIVASSAPDPIKEEAQRILKMAERIGKPLAIKFTAVDGRPVELAKLKGKVVLVDFWATWCGLCVAEVPNVRATYERLHPKGFEIVGISFDTDKQALLDFVQQHKMSWPQYFDGKQWDNQYGKQFGIDSIPAMWLVDKQGNLRDVNAREDLAEKITKLLAELPNS